MKKFRIVIFQFLAFVPLPLLADGIFSQFVSILGVEDWALFLLFHDLLFFPFVVYWSMRIALSLSSESGAFLFAYVCCGAGVLVNFSLILLAIYAQLGLSYMTCQFICMLIYIYGIYLLRKIQKNMQAGDRWSTSEDIVRDP